MSPEKQDFFNPIVKETEKVKKEVEILSRQRSGSNRLIDSVILTAPAATIVFSNIPSIYDHLLLLYYLRGDDPATGADFLQIRFNGDVGANYDYFRAQFFHVNTLLTGEGLAVTSIQPAFFPGGLAPANAFDGGAIRIMNYANTSNHKPVQIVTGSKFGTLTTQVRSFISGGWWRSTAAITSITFFAFTAGNDFDTDSRVDLYGVQGGE